MQNDFQEWNEQSEDEPNVYHFDSRCSWQAGKHFCIALCKVVFGKTLLPAKYTDEQSYHDQQCCQIHCNNGIKVISIIIGAKRNQDYDDRW